LRLLNAIRRSTLPRNSPRGSFGVGRLLAPHSRVASLEKADMTIYLVIAEDSECELPQANHGAFGSASEALDRVRRFRRQGLLEVAIYRDAEPIEEGKLVQLATEERQRDR